MKSAFSYSCRNEMERKGDWTKPQTLPISISDQCFGNCTWLLKTGIRILGQINCSWFCSYFRETSPVCLSHRQSNCLRLCSSLTKILMRNKLVLEGRRYFPNPIKIVNNDNFCFCFSWSPRPLPALSDDHWMNHIEWKLIEKKGLKVEKKWDSQPLFWGVTYFTISLR